MPSPFLVSTTGRCPEFYCSLCQGKFKAQLPDPTLGLGSFEDAVAKRKTVLFEEWDEHLRSTHPRQWVREQKRRARRRAKREKDEGSGSQ
jgi:hypothetical protein